LNASVEIAGEQYHATIEAKRPFKVTLHKGNGADRHEAVWQGGRIIFDVHTYPDLQVEKGKNTDGTAFAKTPWKDGVYDALDLALRFKLIARKSQ